MKTLIKNASIITMEAKDKVLQEGCILLYNDTIEYVGVSLPECRPDKVIDAKQQLVLPGLINAHSHSPMVLMRCLADDASLHEWLFEKIFPVEATLTEDDVYWGSMLGIMEMLSSGITAFADMYFHMNGVARAVSESGIRACLSTGITNLEKSTVFSKNSYIMENRKLFAEWHGYDNGRISVYLGPHAIYTCEPAILEYIAELAQQLHTGIHVHVSETQKENMDCMAQYKKTPVKLLYDAGIFSSPTIAAHCVHLTEEDMDILREQQVTMAYNPTSNLKLGSGLAPIQALMQKGVAIALGTDGAASNNNLNMFEEMNLAGLLSKGVTMNPTAVNAFEALSMATINGAKALGREDLGRLKAGMKADLIIMKLDGLHYQPVHNLLSGMVYAAQAGDVKTVLVDGRIVLDDGQFTMIDKEQVLYHIKKIADKIGHCHKAD